MASFSSAPPLSPPQPSAHRRLRNFSTDSDLVVSPASDSSNSPSPVRKHKKTSMITRVAAHASNKFFPSATSPQHAPAGTTSAAVTPNSTTSSKASSKKDTVLNQSDDDEASEVVVVELTNEHLQVPVQKKPNPFSFSPKPMQMGKRPVVSSTMRFPSMPEPEFEDLTKDHRRVESIPEEEEDQVSFLKFLNPDSTSIWFDPNTDSLCEVFEGTRIEVYSGAKKKLAGEVFMPKSGDMFEFQVQHPKVWVRIHFQKKSEPGWSSRVDYNVGTSVLLGFIFGLSVSQASLDLNMFALLLCVLLTVSVGYAKYSALTQKESRRKFLITNVTVTSIY